MKIELKDNEWIITDTTINLTSNIERSISICVSNKNKCTLNSVDLSLGVGNFYYFIDRFFRNSFPPGAALHEVLTLTQKRFIRDVDLRSNILINSDRNQGKTYIMAMYCLYSLICDYYNENSKGTDNIVFITHTDASKQNVRNYFNNILMQNDLFKYFKMEQDRSKIKMGSNAVHFVTYSCNNAIKGMGSKILVCDELQQATQQQQDNMLAAIVPTLYYNKNSKIISSI